MYVTIRASNIKLKEELTVWYKDLPVLNGFVNSFNKSKLLMPIKIAYPVIIKPIKDGKPDIMILDIEHIHSEGVISNHKVTNITGTKNPIGRCKLLKKFFRR